MAAVEFKTFQKSIEKQFNLMKAHELFRVEVSKDDLWDTYLKSFPKGTNPILKERTEHDCQCCKSFIRAVGNMVAIIDNKVVSIWDCETEGYYQDVANGMAALIKTAAISNLFLHTEKTAGVEENYTKDTPVRVWNHFYVELPKSNVVRGEDIGPKLSDSRASKDVMFRGLTEITLDSLDTVTDLIAQNSLYRGEEHSFAIDSFQKLKKKFDKLKTNTDRDVFCWSLVKVLPASVSRFRNTVIGTLLTDLSEGKELEEAVKAFEAKVAPTNYKRPTALVTKAMIEKAKETIKKLDLEPSLERRYATIEDLTVNNILFVDRGARKKLKGDIFDELKSNVSEKSQTFDKVEEVDIETFVKSVLPKADSIELMLENRHTQNLVSLIAPANEKAKPMFKWANPFSWSYTGELADSIKARVKNAGGKVDGDLRCSLSWFNFDDLDLHMKEPSGYEIQFRNKGMLSPSQGMLDVDMNAGGGTTRSAVENICYADRNQMKEGVYELLVHNWAKRETKDVGFDIEIEYDGVIQTISYAKAVRDQELISVARIRFSHKNGFEIIGSLPSTQTVKAMWGLPSQSFHKAKAVMLSPNYWDEKAVGNKHYFFMLDGCTNEGKARGFFNEFLAEDLAPHRKVLEIVGSKMQTEESDNQLSGLGFSSTQRNSVLCKVKGSFNRVVKITF